MPNLFSGASAIPKNPQPPSPQTSAFKGLTSCLEGIAVFHFWGFFFAFSPNLCDTPSVSVSVSVTSCGCLTEQVR